nr:Kelch-like protein 5-B-3 [Carassius gibelio]
MSNPRKDFDVKQILRIRWRWFGHPTSPPSPSNQPSGDIFSSGGSSRGTGGSSSGGDQPSLGGCSNSNTVAGASSGNGNSSSNINNNRKFGDSCPNSGHSAAAAAAVVVSASSCPRSMSQQECRSSPPAPWVFPAHSRSSESLEPPVQQQKQKQQSTRIKDAPAPGDEENNNNVESDSSSCRLVLSSVSDYFAAMFTSDVREAKQEEIKMEGVDPDALWVLVQYAYTGHLELREDTIESLLSAACLLQLSAVVQACCSYLMKQLHPSNCLGIRSFADAQGCLDLHKVAHNYTMEHFMEVMRHQEFLLLPACEVEKLLASDDMNVPEEETVVTALLSWVRHDASSRQSQLPALLAHIRLPLLKPQVRATSIEQYCLRRDTWRQVAVMSGRRLQFGVAVLEDRLYVVGGRDGLKTLNTVECYNPRSKSWSVMPPMSTHRHGLGVAVLEGPMYAVGGHDGWSYLSTVERWDPQARQWSFVASMATPRSTVGVAVLNSKLYAVGGRDGSSCLKSVECFDPHTNKWSSCAPMSKRRGGVGVATWNGFLYAIGGHDAPASSLASRLSDCVERYDPKTDMWTAVAPMSLSRDAVGVCLLGDRLYAVGGYDGQVYLNTVEAYDPQTNEWTQVAPLCLGRAGACVVAVKL